MKHEHLSKEQLPTYQKFGTKIRVNFDEQKLTETDEDGTETAFFKYRFVDFQLTASRDQRIEAIIANKYPTYGSEIAAINNGGTEYDNYLEHRTLAKQLANGSY